MDASAYLADTLARYTSIEANYGDPEIEDWTHLQDSIIDVYASILKYASTVEAAWQTGTSGAFRCQILWKISNAYQGALSTVSVRWSTVPWIRSKKRS
jgi:hypothetical protein